MLNGRSAVTGILAAVALAVPASAEAQLRLKDCQAGRCGTLSVPLDPSGAVPGRLSLAVLLAPPRSGPQAGVTLLLAGGPGQAGVSAFGDSLFADEWADMWLGLAPRNAVVAFDQRGTGAGALRCRDLEAAALSDGGREAEACAVKLGRKRGLYRTTESVADIEALRVALGVEKLTIVGVSYGTYVAQRYALAHPAHVERLVLDSVLDATGVDPLYLDTAAAVRRMLPAFCRLGCEGFTRDALADTRELTRRLAAEPLRGTVIAPGGRRRTTFLTRQELLLTLFHGDLNPLARADYPAAVVSALRGDSAPLMRLKRRAIGAESGGPPGSLSAATYAATTCEEIRFPWEWHAGPGERAGSVALVEAGLDPALAFPFDPGTLARNDTLRLCRRWPTISAGPPADPEPMPDVPVLLLNGTEDLRTPVENARRAAARFPRGHLLEIRGAGHSVIGFSRCANRALTRFFRGGRIQDRCPQEGPLLGPSAPLPASLGDVAPTRGVPGPRGRVMTAVGLTIGDMLDDLFTRLFVSAQATGSPVLRGGGLRGGSWFFAGTAFRAKRLELVPGVRISIRGSDSAGDEDDEETSRVRVSGPGRLDGTLVLRSASDSSFRARGRIGGQRVRARIDAPVRFLALFGFAEGELSAASALRWLPCVRESSPLPASWLSPSQRLRTRRCASSAVGRTASPARG